MSRIYLFKVIEYGDSIIDTYYINVLPKICIGSKYS